MKLSEAMMLGSTTCKMVPGDWNSCALGCAGNAVGIPQIERLHPEQSTDGRSPWLIEYWPWLQFDEALPGMASDQCITIWKMFDSKVCSGAMTLEQLADYVRSVEPDCGECNRVECTCPIPATLNEVREEQLTH